LITVYGLILILIALIFGIAALGIFIFQSGIYFDVLEIISVHEFVDCVHVIYLTENLPGPDSWDNTYAITLQAKFTIELSTINQYDVGYPDNFEVTDIYHYLKVIWYFTKETRVCDSCEIKVEETFCSQCGVRV
jgi:hypothetical protein